MSFFSPLASDLLWSTHLSQAESRRKLSNGSSFQPYQTNIRRAVVSVSVPCISHKWLHQAPICLSSCHQHQNASRRVTTLSPLRLSHKPLEPSSQRAYLLASHQGHIWNLSNPITWSAGPLDFNGSDLAHPIYILDRSILHSSLRFWHGVSTPLSRRACFQCTTLPADRWHTVSPPPHTVTINI